MYSTFSASKTCQKRLRVPSDLDSAVSLPVGGGRTGKYVNKWNIFKVQETPQMNSDGTHLVLSGSGWRSCERADKDVGVGGHRK